MSLPAAFTGQALSAIPILNPFDAFLQIFNNNPYFIGIMMLVLNLGGRFISLEVTKKQEQFLQLPWVRRVLIFTVLFVATRNLWVAFWTTVIVVLLLGYLFNENSALCLFGTDGISGSTCSESKKSNEEMTPEESRKKGMPFKGVAKEGALDEKLKPSMGVQAYIKDFIKSDDSKFEGESKKERIKRAVAAFYQAKK